MALFDQATINLFLLQFLPFIIIVAILYALLQKSGVLGKSGRASKMLNAVVSLAISAMVVFVNPLGINWATGFAQLFSGTTVIAIFLAFVVIFALMFGGAAGRRPGNIFVLIIAIVLAFIGLGISGIVPQLLPGIEQGQFAGIELSKYSGYIVLAIFFGIIVMILRMFTKVEHQQTR